MENTNQPLLTRPICPGHSSISPPQPDLHTASLRKCYRRARRVESDLSITGPDVEKPAGHVQAGPATKYGTATLRLPHPIGDPCAWTRCPRGRWYSIVLVSRSKPIRRPPYGEDLGKAKTHEDSSGVPNCADQSRDCCSYALIRR